jgi:7-carboxy-7-deazaguanine synthase
MDERNMDAVKKVPVSKPASLPVMESFYTLQGEGFHQGKAAYFVRLGGCDVGCTWCDVKDSWDPASHPVYQVEEIISKAMQVLRDTAGLTDFLPSQQPIAVITGGEPFMHDCTLLTQQLQQAGFRTHVETSGAYPLSGNWDWVCVSPKKFKSPVTDMITRADELKVVIFHPSDFQWAEQFASQVSAECKLFLQPEWGRTDRITPLIIDYIKEHPEWRFSLQLHKYIHVP